MRYKIYAEYKYTIDCGEIEANNEKEAIRKAIDNNIIQSTNSLCWQCEEEMLDTPTLIDNSNSAEKI